MRIPRPPLVSTSVALIGLFLVIPASVAAEEGDEVAAGSQVIVPASHHRPRLRRHR